jgi:diadenosine tetraphosphatase ApaH/serine/threonine PP2A family protein phosphatase
MLLAIMSDIHANRQAFEACLNEAHVRGAERIVLLGDYVGYGADPEWAVDTVQRLAGEGAAVLLGNHDHAINDPSERMNADAQAAIEWTRPRLDAGQRQFLAGLPLTKADGDCFFVHADASKPADWRYVRSIGDAAASISATQQRLSFCGHIHRPLLYSMSSAGRMIAFVPTPDFPVRLLPGRKWLAVMGSVGQPRDGIAAASFALLDTEREVITYCRVPYDIETAATRIRENGLPPWLAHRLFIGK